MVVGRIVKFCRLLWKLRLEYEVLYAFDGKKLQFWRRVKMFCSCLLTKDGDNEMLNEFEKLCAVQGFYPRVMICSFMTAQSCGTIFTIMVDNIFPAALE